MKNKDKPCNAIAILIPLVAMFVTYGLIYTFLEERLLGTTLISKLSDLILWK
jgi:hypothetical protein